MLELEQKIHNCIKCKQVLGKAVRHYPVYAFGDPSGRPIVVVGLNPSDKEYENDHLSSGPSLDVRHNTQLHYFDDPEKVHGFFHEVERFFQGEVKEKLQWEKSPSERVGYLDLVKCPTIPSWTDLERAQQRQLVENCEGYLIEQLEQYTPKMIIAYGRDVGRWFAKKLGVEYKPFEATSAPLGKRHLHLLFVPQKQGPHSEPEILRIREEILKFLRTLR